MTDQDLEDILKSDNVLLDENEFDIPIISQDQTLENILNEDEPLEIEEDLLASHLDGLVGGDTISVSSGESYASTASRRILQKKHRANHGIILRHGLLKSANGQLAAAKDRVDAGTPTCLAVTSMLAVGTGHGLIFVFDNSQVLKHCLGSASVGAQYGSVSSLSFNRDNTRLLAGFAKGQILMWDLNNGKLLRTITDAHAPGTAVLFVMFTDDPTVAICSDSGGSVFQLEFKRKLVGRTCDSVCLFSGSRGEMCCISPLNVPPRLGDHPLGEFSLLAMASFTKVFIVSLKPTLKVQFTNSLTGDSSTLPLLTWQFILVDETSLTENFEPLLLFARDNVVHLIQVSQRSETLLAFTRVKQIQLSYRLLDVSWMSPQTLTLIDVSEKLHLIDVSTEKELETDDLNSVQLCYNISLFKSLATGGNVSKALEHAGQRACYHSIIAFEGQLVLLGMRSVHVFRLRTWEDRLSVLAKRGFWEDALSQGIAFYDGTAKAVVGLPNKPAQRKQRVEQRLRTLLSEFADQVMSQPYPEHVRMRDLQDSFEIAAHSCIETCITINSLDVLFDDIYKKFSNDPVALAAFLEALQPQILKERIETIPPEVIKSLVKHLKHSNRLVDMEACIVHLDVAALDINSVVKICRKYGLHDAYLYIYCQGIRDYITPLEYLTSQLSEALRSEAGLTKEHVVLGNKLLVYINCCLTGMAYPMGEIPEEIVEEVKKNVLSFLCAESTPLAANESPFVNLATLLKFDARSFLNNLAIVWAEPDFQGAEGLARKNQLVWRLYDTMVQRQGFTSSQIGALSVFLARQLSRPENAGLQVKADLFEQVLEFLFSIEEEGQAADEIVIATKRLEHQQAVLELLGSKISTDFSRDRMLVMAERAKFYQVCEFIYRERGDLAAIMECYLNDPVRAIDVFAFIIDSLSDSALSDIAREALRNQCFNNIHRLVDVDCVKAASLVFRQLGQQVESFLHRVKDDSSLYLLLKGFFTLREGAHEGSPVHEAAGALNPSVAERYLDLLSQRCRDQPADDAASKTLLDFLKRNNDYRPAYVLIIFQGQRLDHFEAISFLVEKKGDFEKALEMYLGRINTTWEALLNRSADNSCNSEKELKSPWLEDFQQAVESTVAFCRRASRSLNSSSLEETEIRERKSALWFPILECLLDKQKSTDLNYVVAILKGHSQTVLSAMSGHVSLPVVMERLLRHPAYRHEHFGQVRELLLSMLATGNYERTLLETCKRLAEHDLVGQMRQLQHTWSRGYGPKTRVCRQCSQEYINGIDRPLVVFRCGHSYHQKCLRPVALGSHVTWLCPICTSSENQARAERLQGARPRLASAALPDLDNEVSAAGDALKLKMQSANQEGAIRFERMRKALRPLDHAMLLRNLQEKDTRPFRSNSRAAAGGQPDRLLQDDAFVLSLAPKSTVFTED